MSEGIRPPAMGDWEECVDRLYDAVGREDALGEALGRFRPFFDARSATFLTMPDGNPQSSVHIANCGVSTASLVEYHSHHYLHDEWVISARRSGGIRLNAAYRGTDLVPLSRLKRTYFWRDFLARYGVTDILGVVVEVAGDHGPAAMCTFHRVTGQAPYEADCLHLMATLTPHLRRALRLHRRLAPELSVGSTLRQVFSATDTPMLFVARDGQVAEANAAAVSLIAEKNSVVRLVSGRLMVRSADAWRGIDLDLARFNVETEESFQVFAKDPGSSTALNMTVRRMHGAFTDLLVNHPIAAIVTLTSVTIDKDANIRKVYGLTPSESRVAALLARGSSVSEVAQTLRVTIPTVRTHLASLFSKTGAKRQAELVTLLLRGDSRQS